MDSPGQEPLLEFSQDDVQRFASWSADRNPLHVNPAYARLTHFGQQVVHGVLTVLRTLEQAASESVAGQMPCRLDIEFRSAVLTGRSYRWRAAADGAGSLVTLLDGTQPALNVRITPAGEPRVQDDSGWVTGADRPPRTVPAEHLPDALRQGVVTTGCWPQDQGAPFGAGLSPTLARVLALCSYVTGMEVPGLRSLFTRITIDLHVEVPAGSELRYRARTTRFDPSFRLLDTDLVVATPDGTIVASGVLRSYVPFSPRAIDLDLLAGRMVDASWPEGTVALVTGGTRGLGAEIAASLALAGAHVYVSARQHDDDARQVHDALQARGARIEFVPGDAGDAQWCQDLVSRIAARHGRLDVLVLNACAPPPLLRLGADTADARERYVQQNLRLVEAPLDASIDLLTASKGTAVFVSSSFVHEAPAGFSHYVALKQAGEAITRTMVRERRDVAGLIVRPPVLQTRWNDTPSGVVGSIPSDRAASRIALAARTGVRAGDAVVIDEFPAFTDAPRPAPGGPSSFALRVAATFTTDPLLPALRFWVRELAVDARIDVAPYGQVLQSLLDPASVLNAKGRGANVVLLRVADWLRELSEEHVADIDRVKRYLQETARDFEAAVRAHRGQAGAETLLLVCPSHGANSSAESILVRQTEDALTAALGDVPGLQLVQASRFHPVYQVDEDTVYDSLRDHIAHIPYRDDYLHVLAAVALRHVHRRLSPVRKVVVVDCDNTLWRGVVGEVGAEGLEFDAGHQALHALLTRLTEQGLLVCLCSKNEEADVWRVFEARADFGLRRDHVVAAMINWLPKSQNLRTLAGRLNLGLDSFIFIDDNPVECAEVRAGCPEVLTVQWPQDPALATQLTRHFWELDGGKATKEDARRTALYKEEFERQEARAQTLTFEDFIKNLQLEVDFAPLNDEDLRRAAQLTLRTNQFNFTTIRREEADVQALAAGGQHEIRTVRVRDRFGDYGLVGLVIAERGQEAWNLDTFLLSCRVLGRGVEHHIVSDLGRMAAAAGASQVTMRVETTKRNTPARSFFESVVPAEYREGDDRAVRAVVPVDALQHVRFEPAVTGEVVVQEDGGSKAAQPVDADALRRREEQIARAAFVLVSGAAMRAEAEGRQAPASPAATPGAATHADVAGLVHATFAEALSVSPQRVAEVDRLEALGCDSLRIVEITVALSAHYPWLPGTLLFEHRTVSGIVDEIVRLSAPTETPGSGVRASAPDRTVSFGGDIAVVGIGVRCAGASSPDELWALLSEGRSAVQPVPRDRRHFLRPLTDERPHWAGLLDDVARFDPEFFGVAPREAEVMDPQLRLFLEVAWSALEDAGLVGGAHEPETGVYAGVMYGDYGYRANGGAKAGAGPYRCWEGFSLANRLSQLLDFHGPSFAVETACSSSGTAIHLACTALKAGECRVAIAGGVNLILDPDRFASLGRLGILSARGICEPFGADADGTVLGEGAGVVVLRPLADAVARGDRIYGVIKGTGLSTGSGTVGFTAPNPVAQAEAIRRSLRTAAIDPRTVSYIETHGTGTLLGDPIEVRGLSLGYGDHELQEPGVDLEHHCAIGSLKPNVGHLEAGAGVLGLIKILLQFAHRTLLPSLTSARPSPQIPFDQLPFSVQRTASEWVPPRATLNGAPVSVPRRAGLNSFGVGGANAHLVVEEPPQPAVSDTAMRRPVHVLALSAVSDSALARQSRRVAAFLDSARELDVADVCYSINTGRRHLPRRVAIAARDAGELRQALLAAADRRHAEDQPAPKVAFLFTGQGSQYAGMGRTLYETHPVFRSTIDRCAEVFDRLLDRPLRSLLFAEPGSEEAALLDQTGYTQPALFAFQVALAELWRSWGVRPDIVLGHSVGEIAAMCVAGGVSLEDGLTLIAARGRLMQALPAGGVMTSVMADESKVQAAIDGAADRVAIAAVNGPGQVVISGAGAAVAEIAARLDADGIKTKALTVSHAFHSPLMQPMLAAYADVVRTIAFSEPRVPLVTCVDAARGGVGLTDAGYWLRQVTEPVRFADAMRVLDADGVTAYVEIGPHPVLVGLGRQCVADEARSSWVPSLRRDADEWRTMLDGVCQVYERGVDVDWRAFDAPYARTRVPVPGYAFGEREYWLKHVPALVDAASATAVAAEPASSPQAYGLSWQPAPLSGAPPAPSAHWVVLADESGVGDAVSSGLRSRGYRVTRVWPSAAYAANDTGVTLDPLDESHYARLFDWLGPQTPVRLVHCWSLDAPGNDTLDVAALEDVQSRQLLSLGRLAHASMQASGIRARISVITRNAVAVEPDAAPVSLAQAPVWGFGRTVALEYPEVWGGLIDLETGDTTAPARLTDELLAQSGEDQVALRARRRFVPRLRRVEGSDRRPSFSPQGTYLVTGGVGALGLHAAEWLVAHGARQLLLVSRSGRVTAAAEPRLAALRAGGATVDVRAADIADAAALDQLLALVAGSTAPLRGVIHAAGVDGVASVETIDAAAVHDVFGAKAGGAWLLHQRTRALNLDLFLCFSSMSAVLGAQGRAHYAAANAFLDALAAERRRLGLAATAVAWGPWAGGGMASGDHLRQFERIGNRGLDPRASLRLLDRIVTSDRPDVMVADIDWDVFAPAYEARGSRPVLSSTADQRQAPTDRRAAETAGDAAPWAVRLSEVASGDRESTLVTLVRAEVADAVGFDDAESVALDRSFFELGVDSLTMADLVTRIRAQVGFPCNTLVFQHPSVRALARQLLPRLAADLLSGAVVPEQASADDASFTIEDATVGYSADIEEAAFDFQARAWPHRSRALVPARWRWMFVESARRIGVPPRVWLHRAGGQVVGHMGSIAVRLKIRDDVRDTGWLVDTMVAEEFRRHGLGAQLMVQAHDDQPFSLSLGQTSEMREIQLRLGWQQVAPLQVAQLLIRPERVLRGKLPKPAAFAAGLGLRASSAVRGLVRGRAALTTRELSHFDERHDVLWQTMAATVTCGVVRDASYLNWKYVAQPGQDFVRLDVFDGARLVAAAVLAMREPDAAYKYRRALLVDLVAPLVNDGSLSQVLSAVAAAAEARGADSLVCLHVSPVLTGALTAVGFTMRTPERVLLVDPGPLPAAARSALLDGAHWFVTQGDSDIDRPW